VSNDLIHAEFEEESELRKHGICSYVAIQLAGPGADVAALMFASRAVRRFDALTIGTLLDHVDEWSRTRQRKPAGESESEPPRTFDDEAVIGESPEFLEVCRLIAQVSRIDSTVLIRGESGTGKKRLARTIHRYSDRADRTLTRVDGSSLGESFERAESEAADGGPGAEVAAALDGGILLVDEIANLSAPDQATLLRLLQENEAPSDPDNGRNARVIATTGADLDTAMARGRFRQALY
jgi:DNA-binding NtrC family response regulator